MNEVEKVAEYLATLKKVVETERIKFLQHSLTSYEKTYGFKVKTEVK